MRWQYTRVEVDIAAVGSSAFGERLDRLGAEGWELVTAVQHARHGYSHEVHLVFKRAALEPGELAAQ
jgi:hypothetical protein